MKIGPGDAPIREEAALWFARLRGAEADDIRPAFEAWLARDPRHRAEYNRMAEIFSLHRRTVARSGRRRSIVVATGILVAAALSLCLLPNTVGWWSHRVPPGAGAGSVQDWASGAGSIRQVTLDDGSRVVLDANSRFQVRFDVARRSIVLIEGRARFDVAHEPRPFTVLANGTTVTARGTLFDVSVMPARPVRVVLYRGAVDIDSAGRAGRTHMRLVPGEQLTVLPDVPASPAPIGARTGPDWPEAVFDYDAIPLDRVVADANHYAIRPIVLEDSDLGNILVSGHFRVSDGSGLADQLAEVLGLSVDRSDPARLRLHKSATGTP